MVTDPVMRELGPDIIYLSLMLDHAHRAMHMWPLSFATIAKLRGDALIDALLAGGF